MMLVHDGNEIISWRKANAIHKWFVDNVQGGVDDCGGYKVTKEQLIQLHNECNEVLNNPNLAEQLLPTQPGFFFGGTEYDEWYFNDIDNTIKILEDALSDENADDFTYRASW